MLPPETGAITTQDIRCSAGVQAHQAIAARPVDFQRQCLTGFWSRRSGGGLVQHDIKSVVFARVLDRNAFTVGSHQDAVVANLATTKWIEDRPVQLDPLGCHATTRPLATFR
jgi:hypothetical protein